MHMNKKQNLERIISRSLNFNNKHIKKMCRGRCPHRPENKTINPGRCGHRPLQNYKIERKYIICQEKIMK